MRILLQLQLFVLLLLPLPVWSASQIVEVEVVGAIGPVTQDLAVRAIDRANEISAHLVILKLNTPGGLDHSMREIIRAILASKVPVVSWVTPPGARAASAGTYILYASHVAAMSPATNLGAATPVSIASVPKVSPADDGNDHASTMSKKVINDAVAYITGLARLRGRNEEWARQAVEDAVSLTAEEALRLDVIDLIATDRDDLFRQLDGRVIEMPDGPMTLSTQKVLIEHMAPDWRSRLLAVITDPNIAYLLLLAGIYGLFIEFTHPGYILPGVTGSISLLLALYAFQVLPVNSAGLMLLALGLVFIVAEAFVTSGGVLGIGGVIAFVAGSIILFDEPALNVSLPLIFSTALIAAGFLLWLLGWLVRLKRKRAVTGEEALIGEEGVARDDISAGGEGWVKVDGELWKASSDKPIKAGQKVVINKVERLHLWVSPEEEA